MFLEHEYNEHGKKEREKQHNENNFSQLCMPACDCAVIESCLIAHGTWIRVDP